jgi:hypothetical protein
MLKERNQTDKLLITVNISILVGFLFVFQLSLTHTIVKWTLFISLILYVISLLLLIWHTARYPIRTKLFDELKEKTIKKYSGRIAKFIEEIIVPFARLKAKDEVLSKLEKINTREEYGALIKHYKNEIHDLEQGTVGRQMTRKEDEATSYVVESFVEQVGHASREDYNKAFKSPLKEKYAKLKYRIDRIALRSRRHFFASGSVFAIFSMFVQILSQK